MKRLMILMMSFLMVLSLTDIVSASEYSPDVDYAEAMIKAAYVGDVVAGEEYCRLRRLKMADMGINDSLQFDCLYLLAKIIYTEAGSSWLTEEHRQLVASVIVNRVKSPEFPNTMYEVVYQRGQYAGVGGWYFENLIPSRWCVDSAYKVLTNGTIAPPSVVFQAEFPQGSGTYKTIYDPYLGTTYFCYSNKPWLY